MSKRDQDTEKRNPFSFEIDMKSTKEILEIINKEDQKVPKAITKSIDNIAIVVDKIVDSMKKGGKLLYIGAGTSGRLGVLDASECPPTFGVSDKLVQGIIAGGQVALTKSIEGAEDDEEAGVNACKAYNLKEGDVLIGITANGGAPFVISALKYANSINAISVAISSNKNTSVFDVVDENNRIYAPVGPEIVTGSTRMKSGTAQKLILNMISTTVMIKLGKVYNNLMVDLKAVNKKLVKRSLNIIMEVCDCDLQSAKESFDNSGSNTKVAIIMQSLDVNKRKALELLEENSNSIREVFKKYK